MRYLWKLCSWLLLGMGVLIILQGLVIPLLILALLPKQQGGWR